MTDSSQIRLGTAPDSWGVWFAEHPDQLPWHQFLDEAQASGYTWVELGPYGYLPTDPERLRDELGSRGLRLSGGAVFAGLHRGPDALKQAIADCRQEAELLTALGAEHLILLPELYTELDGSLNQPRQIDADQWHALTGQLSELARFLREGFGVQLDFHSHADSHVGTQDEIVRLLENTDPESVRLCLDTGHIAYYGGDNIAIVRTFPERIGYVHLKQVDPVIVAQVADEGLAFPEAVRRGVMVEPPHGEPAMEPLLAELDGLGVPLFGIVEQDLFPCRADVPQPIAQRTRQYFNVCGLRPIPA